MGSSVIMIIIFGVCILAFGIYYLIDKSKGSKPATDTGKAQSTSAQKKEEPAYKGKNNSIQKQDMSSFLRFDKIANDMIHQKNGERYSMVIECKGINYELMSEIEQMAVEEGFITFLNTLKFPIQLYVQTRSVDLSENIKQYKKRVETFDALKQEAVEENIRIEDDIDSLPEEIDKSRRERLKYTNIAEYVEDITKYVERLALNKYLLQRKFYIIFSYNKSEIVATEKFSDEEYEELCYRELYTRAQGIISSLLACSVQGSVLNSNELAELIYISINKDDQKAINIKEALDSGFYRLYSTGEDVRERRQQLLDEEIKNASMKRIENAIREGIANGTIITEDELEKEIDKRIDKTALRIVDGSNLSKQAKEEIKNIITENRRERLRREKEKEEKEIAEKIERSEAIVEQQVEQEETVIASDESTEDESIV